ncbi:MAG: hypothetical protein JEY94_11060 [Melioribacteraceae bacterium]|nr:hypothetical protein [Melioribacteraceae bacterium]
MKKLIQNLSLLLFISLVVGCATEKKEISDETKNTVADSLQQTKDDLMAGITRAVAYSGFREGQHPDRGNGASNPTYEETLEDLKILSRDDYFQLIRLYDCDENSQMVLKVIKENNLNIKVMQGLWLDAEISNHEGCGWLTEPIKAEKLAANKKSNLEEIEMGIKLANKYPDIIVAVNVGNEMLVEWNDHMCELDTAITYVKRVQNSIKQPVSVAENSHWWANKGAKLAEVVDFLAVHVYPLWEGQDITNALEYSIENTMMVKRNIPNKKIVITELGWATVAAEFGERASEEKQEIYYNKIYNWAERMNITTFFFEAFDEPWKGETANPDGAEKHWGIFNVDRTPKKVMQKLYPDLIKK